MKLRKLRVPRQYADWVVVAVASAGLLANSLLFSPWGLPWLAWAVLGYFAIVTLWRDFIVVKSSQDEPVQKDRISAPTSRLIEGLFGVVIVTLGLLEILPPWVFASGVAYIFVIYWLLGHTIGRQS